MGIDPNALLAAMIAGATTLGQISGTEVVKEVTKDAYKSLKSTLTRICGSRAESAAKAVEMDPSSEEARSKLLTAIGTIPEEDVEALSAALTNFKEKLKDDAVAQKAASLVGGIKLDITSGGSVNIERIDQVRNMEVRSHSEGDFTLRDVKMAGDREGN